TVLFFFSSRRRHTRSYGDWSSDVCSSDLLDQRDPPRFVRRHAVTSSAFATSTMPPKSSACSSATRAMPVRRRRFTRARSVIALRSEEHTSELQSPYDLVCRLLLEKKKKLS